MKRIKYIIVLLVSLTALNSCVVEDNENPFYPPNEYGVYPIISDVVNGFFDLASPANASVGFTINPSVSGGAQSTSGEVHVNFNGGTYVKIEDMSGFPHTATYSLSEVASATGVSIGSLALGDGFRFKYYFNVSNGPSMTSSKTLNVPMSCVSSLAGTYTMTTTYGYHDFLPDYGSNTMTMEVVEVADGVYEIFDMSGGLYSDGPYKDNYGTDETSFTVQFRDTCNSISWEGQSDAWGACIPLAGGVNGVDPDTGVITLSWFCEAYGENGVSVLTPL